MGLYDHYTDVDPSSIKSATSSLRTKLTTAREKLSTFKTSLTDEIWKATAKATLTTACDKLDSEVYNELLTKLDNADTIADEITAYNSAKSEALSAQSSLAAATEKTSSAQKSAWLSIKTTNEQTMQDCIDTISSLQ